MWSLVPSVTVQRTDTPKKMKVLSERQCDPFLLCHLVSHTYLPGGKQAKSLPCPPYPRLACGHFCRQALADSLEHGKIQHSQHWMGKSMAQWVMMWCGQKRGEQMCVHSIIKQASGRKSPMHELNKWLTVWRICKKEAGKLGRSSLDVFLK